MSNGSSTPSAFKRIFVGADDAFAGQVVATDIFQVAGPYGPILRVGSTPTEDYVIWTGTANTSFGEIDVGANLDNYFTISGAASGSSPLISAVGTTDANVGIGLLPKANYMTTTTRMLVGPQASWAAAQTSNATRLRTQLAAFHTSFVHTSGQEFYPQFSVAGGSQTGTVDAGDRHGHSVMSIDNDNLVTVAGGTGPEGLAMLYVGVGAGNANGAAGGAHAGGRAAVDANIFVNSDVDIGAGTIFHVALAGNTTAYRRMGGVPGSHRGNVFGSLLAARGQNLGGTGPGPRYLNSIVSLEADVEQQANVSALWKMGIQIVEEKDSAANAIQQNIGLLLANQPSATTIGWNQGISFGGYNGQWPIASNGQVIATLPTPIGVSTFDAADGLNLRRVTFSRAAIETPGFFVDGSGNLGGEKVGGLSLQTVSAVNAKVSTVSSVTVVDGGVFDGGNPAPFPTFTIASPATSGGVSGTTATMTVATMGAVGFSGISTGGNGLYVAGETLTAVGGTGTAFTVYIETVTAGTPTNIRVASAGSYTVLPTNPVSFTGSATGTGFTLGMLWTILTVSRTAGTNYNELRPPVVTYTGAMTQTREARFKLAMTAGTAAPIVLGNVYANYATFTGATATGVFDTGAAVFQAAGSDTHIDLKALGKGTNGRLNSLKLYIGPTTSRAGVNDATTAYLGTGTGYSTTAAPGMRVGGNFFGTVTSGQAFYHQVAIDADTVDPTTGSGPLGATGFYVGHTVSATAKGGRNAFNSVLNIAGAITASSSGDGAFYTAAGATAQASANAGGSSGLGNGRGNIFGGNRIAHLLSGATFWNSMIGDEVTIGARTGSSLYYKNGFQISIHSLDTVAGTGGFDSGLVFAQQINGASPGWNVGITFGHALGWWPMKSDSTLIGTVAGAASTPAYAAAYGVDFNAVTFSTGAFRSTGFLVDGSGRMKVVPWGDYINDAAAAAGGVPVTGVYRNGSILMTRVV